MHGGNKQIAFRAQENLEKIGTTLALKKRESKLYSTVFEWVFVYKKLKAKKILTIINPNLRNLRLKELFGDDIVNSLDHIPNTYGKLANVITAKIMGLTPEVVAKYCTTEDAGTYRKCLKRYIVV